MISCPNCGKKIDVPTKKIENSLFRVYVYTCNECGTHFKISQ
jgi:DNA-directed RNA polymerase subunit RPC12/RpoP